MKTKTEKILMAMTFLAYLAIIGFSIECGGQIVSLIITLNNPDLSRKLYYVNEGFLALKDHGLWYYILAMSLVISISALQIYVWYCVIQLLSKLNLRNPFSMEVANNLKDISYGLLSIWLVSVVGKIYIEWTAKATGETQTGIGVADEFFFIAGIVYIIAQVFKRGIEIQEENQLTV